MFRLALSRNFELRLGTRMLRPRVGEQRLVALLAVRGALPRSAVAGLLWPDVTERRAQGNLRTALWRLAKLCPGLVLTDRDRLALGAVEVDVAELKRWAFRLVEGGAPVDGDVGVARTARSELLPGWYDDWVVAEREQLRQLHLHALDALARELAARGRHAVAIQIALSAVALDPLRESAHRTLVALHLAEGNLAEATRQMQSFTKLLRTELGVTPSPRMARLFADRMPETSGR